MPIRRNVPPNVGERLFTRRRLLLDGRVGVSVEVMSNMEPLRLALPCTALFVRSRRLAICMLVVHNRRMQV